MGVFMDKKNSNWGGRRQGAGRPKKWEVFKVLIEHSCDSNNSKQVSVGEKRRIFAVRKVLHDYEELVKPYRETDKEQGDYKMLIQFLDEIKESDSKFGNVKKEKPNFVW